MYVFFLDIDGTVYGGKPISAAVTRALKRARDSGHKVFINTARAYIGMPREIYELEVDGYVNSLGLEVYADGKFIHRYFIPYERALEIAEYAFDNNIKMYFEGEIRIDINRYREGSLHPKNLSECEKMLKGGRVCKFVIDGEPDERVRATFGEDFDFVGGEAIAKGYSKSHGIKIVEDHYGIEHENTVAMGDTDPDIDMVTYAGIGIAMGNGTQNLKNSVRYVTKSFGEDGVAYAIDCLLDGEFKSLEKQI